MAQTCPSTRMRYCPVTAQIRHPDAATKPVYLDYQATTPLDPRVAEAMAPYWSEMFGNPHSTGHGFGWEAKEAVEVARAQVADFIGADDGEVFFVSGATESCNLAIRGVAATAGERRHIVTVSTEHPAVLETVKSMTCHGFTVDVLPVANDGLLELDALQEAISERTLMVSVMLVNNEIGVIQPISEIAAISHAVGAYVHTDATQAAGRMSVNVEDLGVDLLSLSAHKFYGPNGVGVLYVRNSRRPKLRPLFTGGSQERGLRPGTLATPLVVGLGMASEVAQGEWEQDAQRLQRLATDLRLALCSECPDVQVFGSLADRVAGNLSVGFPGILAEQLVHAVSSEVAVSTGAACSTGSPKPSHVLSALGCSAEVAATGLRISLGRFTTEREVASAIDTLGRTVKRLAGRA